MNNNNDNNTISTDPIVDELLQSILDHIHNHPQLDAVNQEIDNLNQEIEHTFTSNPMGIATTLNIPGIPSIFPNSPGIVFNHGPISSLGNTIESDSDSELITPIDLINIRIR